MMSFDLFFFVNAAEKERSKKETELSILISSEVRYQQMVRKVMVHFTTNDKVNGWMKETDEIKFNKESNVPYTQKDDNKKDFIILLQISFQNYVLVTVGAPILALIIDFLLGFSLDYQQILAYDWSCGVSLF
ncbi:unnamed protein product [Brugia timori]|uniref:Uncharacterized protein n=1 Tax=Brugia timori TaxID=42155 RepID=A0A3P7ZS01_9BILA|nr:unnamed protein product [Brugia timori]